MSVDALIVCAAVGDAAGLEAVAAAVAVAATPIDPGAEGTVLLDLRPAARSPKGTLLAAPAARALEAACRGEGLRAAARGRLCVAAPDPGDARSASEMLDVFGADGPGPALLVCLCAPADFRPCLASGTAARPAAFLRSSPGADRSLLALVAAELAAAAIPLKVWSQPIGLVAARRAGAGLEPGGESGRRAARLAARLAGPPRIPRRRPGAGPLAAERAQALPGVLGAALVTIALALILLAIGGAATAKGRLQRSADLVALSAARSMRDDLPRLFVPLRRADGSIDPRHLERDEYLERARAAALDAAERNDLAPELVVVRFPDGGSFAPLRIATTVRAGVEVDGEAAGETEVRAEAEVTPPSSPGTAPPATATGGGYSGVLAYRQGEPMRPDVAAAFDRMAAAASSDGVSLLINSGYRSDAEQRALWEANPDPRMVAPPGTSLHRCGTELDLGPPEAHGWLAANAGRFGFLQRYSWEAWHFGFTDGPEPCSAEGEAVGRPEADGDAAGEEGLQSFVPERYRTPLVESASRHGVSAALLAAQIMAESNFNPAAVSPAGALGISQFMPATAAAYGLDDPFDPVASIDAQARMMAELLGRFGSVELALAAYNAGPGAVEGCMCIPPYPETQAYVVRIMGLMGGAGELIALAPALEVKLVA